MGKNNMASTSIFPKQETQPQKSFGYKSRNMSHKVRPVKVPIDTKDVKYKPPGTDNERYQSNQQNNGQNGLNNQQNFNGNNQNYNNNRVDYRANGDAPATKKSNSRARNSH